MIAQNLLTLNVRRSGGGAQLDENVIGTTQYSHFYSLYCQTGWASSPGHRKPHGMSNILGLHTIFWRQT